MAQAQLLGQNPRMIDPLVGTKDINNRDENKITNTRRNPRQEDEVQISSANDISQP